MPTYRFRDVFVVEYDIEADSLEEAERLADEQNSLYRPAYRRDRRGRYRRDDAEHADTILISVDGEDFYG